MRGIQVCEVIQDRLQHDLLVPLSTRRPVTHVNIGQVKEGDTGRQYRHYLSNFRYVVRWLSKVKVLSAVSSESLAATHSERAAIMGGMAGRGT